jgi:hypothetical protein
MQTLDLQDAARFLHIHPITLLKRANAGIIPGAKPGKCWVFFVPDLVAYIRAQYRQQASHGPIEENSWNRTDEKTPLIGGSKLPEGQVESQYAKVLALPTRKKPKSTR